ncbi:PREDICTED: uncharacterized protein LOC105152119 [Acromyrmex echinatior]|uniref:uncharacterized protein LOC105152119 n=1 Tax=Acromyrmex echinatior TaxID=103372 RepID=UPI000580B565|nr:PREDICTED: uncharacterized protein LOC105152119 [Acromyrmex echinatior]
MLFYALSAICSVAAFGFFVTGEYTLPVSTCKQDAADNSACLKQAFEKAWPRFIEGLPEFDFPPMDPLFYEYGKVMLNSGELRGELIMSNVTAIGLSKARIFNARTQFLSHDVFRLEIGVQMPKLFLKGAAKINGSLSIFRIVNEGNFNITLNDVRALWEITGHVVNDTWIVEQFHITPLIGKFKIYYKDLSESTKEFSDLLINFVNEYWPTIYRTVLPIMAKEWDKFYIDIANRLFAKVSFSKVFP